MAQAAQFNAAVNQEIAGQSVTGQSGKRGLSRKARLVRTGILLALVVTGANQLPSFLGAAAASNTAPTSVSVHYISVRSGDSLWTLAQTYAPHTDPRDWIDRVTVMNNLDAAGIQVGERIAIPGN